MERMTKANILTAAAFTALLAGSALAQINSGIITGIVTDAVRF